MVPSSKVSTDMIIFSWQKSSSTEGISNCTKITKTKHTHMTQPGSMPATKGIHREDPVDMATGEKVSRQ